MKKGYIILGLPTAASTNIGMLAAKAHAYHHAQLEAEKRAEINEMNKQFNQAVTSAAKAFEEMNKQLVSFSSVQSKKPKQLHSWDKKQMKRTPFK